MCKIEIKGTTNQIMCRPVFESSSKGDSLDTSEISRSMCLIEVPIS